MAVPVRAQKNNKGEIMKAKITMNILAGTAILGLTMCGAEAPTMAGQISISTFGFCMFAGSGWGIYSLLRDKEAGK